MLFILEYFRGERLNYFSTRGINKKFSFSEVFFSGLAPDGGLFLPESIPAFTPEDFKKLLAMGEVDFSAGNPSLIYKNILFQIVSRFVDIDEDELVKSIERSYRLFTHPKIAPLEKIGDNHFFLELFHSPTFAFKDYALQFLGNLFGTLQKNISEHYMVLGATSGDTGSASIHAFRGTDIPVVILYPHNKVSNLQRRQMTTLGEEHVHCLAIEGNFDDCQRIVKEIFRNPDLLEGHTLVAVNSINWVRIMAQIAYYFSAYFQSGADYPEKVVFSVPTGNFGNILAGYLAGKMGLPIEKLILGCNENDILHRLIRKNDYRKEGLQSTYSPSMDIVISSNLERYLYYLHEDPEVVRKMMDGFNETGRIVLEEVFFKKLQKDFYSVSVDKEECLESIQRYHQKGHLVDPHSAIALRALEQAEKDLDLSNFKMIALGTAHPGKFVETMERAGCPVELPDELKRLEDQNIKEKFTVLPNQTEEIKLYLQKIMT